VTDECSWLRHNRRVVADPTSAFGTAQPDHELISGVHRVHDSDARAAHSVLQQIDGHNLSRCSMSNRDAAATVVLVATIAARRSL